MLIPRYSLRWLLGLTTVSAGVSLVLSYAVRGHAWAIGITAGLWTFVAVAVLFVAAFLCAWLIDQFATSRQISRGGRSPFGPQPAGDAPFAPLPPQQPTDTPPAITGGRLRQKSVHETQRRDQIQPIVYGGACRVSVFLGLDRLLDRRATNPSAKCRNQVEERLDRGCGWSRN